MKNLYITLFVIGLMGTLAISYYLQADLVRQLEEKGLCVVPLKGISPFVYECDKN